MKDNKNIEQLRELVTAGAALTSGALSGGQSETIWQAVAARESVANPASKDIRAVAVSQADSANTKYNAVTGKKLGYASKVISNIIMALASPDNARQWQHQLATESVKPTKDYIDAGYNGSQALSLDYNSKEFPMLAREYYTDKDYGKNLGLSWTLNVRALETQSAFAETLYPTIPVEQNDVGVTVRTKVTTVTRGQLNALIDKDSVLDVRRRLHDALTDYTVLQDDAIRIIPYVYTEAGAAGEKAFVKETIYPNELVKIGRCPEYPTNFLDIANTKLNLFRLSAHPGLVQEGYDETDEIATGASLGSLLVSIHKAGEAVSEKGLVVLNTRDMQFSTFQPVPEGDGREMILNFRQTKFALSGDAVDTTGAPIEAAAAFKAAGLTLRYSITLTMTVRTGGQNSGNVQILGYSIEPIDCLDAEGNVVNISEGTAKTLVDGIGLDLVGWKFYGTRTNENRRTQGLLLDPIWETENYKLQYGSPILTKSPINEEYDDAQRVDDLVSAINIRNEGLVVSQTINYSEQIRDIVATQAENSYDKPSIRGLGRMWIQPWYEEIDYDVAKHINSLETKDCLTNARMGLLNRIGDQVCRAVQESRYLPALRLLTANPEARPTIIIATDEPTAAMLLYIQGENRILGDRYDYKVITTNDLRWRQNDEDYEGTKKRRLQWMLHVDAGEGGYNVLNWGNHFWTPIIITNTNIQRNGAVSKELAAQPRNAHINHCPITGIVWIKGITPAVNNKLAYKVEIAKDEEADTETPPASDGGDTGGTGGAGE